MRTRTLTSSANAEYLSDDLEVTHFQSFSRGQVPSMTHPDLSIIPAGFSYRTGLGAAYAGDSKELLASLPDDSVQLVMTSPPFALQRKKDYGNPEQHEYVDWLADFGRLVYQKLRPDGSFVLDLGGAYMKGVPARSLYNFRTLIKFCDEIGFFLAEDFYWFNPSKLPSPIEWVNKRKLRAKDSVNTVWWFGKTEWPKANVSAVLAPYSDRMKKLLKDPSSFYTPKKRPSGHDIGSSFGTDNGGAIPSNLLSFPNSESNSSYLAACKVLGLQGHPARFPPKLPEFFIKLLTEPNDLVVDIFGGSNTTGMVAEGLKRRWLTADLDKEYVAASLFRFLPHGFDASKLRHFYDQVLASKQVDLSSVMTTEPLELHFDAG